ncbi:nucleolar and coiled-body phosphoprotein 1 [Drosophila innubila]|uniref:nucleolar and coiled-body phosphoprotein 1 n=1 Tax=Drosophila innubila TaxID=198719 RepID=UPI00148C9B58|nr:nucleolar and coiled-body phosphoprotein 1 [Drosophila innubila]
MKYFNICLLFVICALCYGLVASQEEGGANVSPAKRIAALRRPVGKAAKPTTTTTTAAPAHEDGAEEDEYNEEAGAGGENGQYGDENEETGGRGAAISTTTTTTETPKKVGPVIRPHMSNDNFFNSLKRRQQNAKKHRSEKTPVSKPAKKSDETNDEQNQDNAPAPSAAAAPAPAASAGKGYKGNPALSRRKPSKPVKAAQSEPEADAAAEESEQQQKEEEPKPKRPLSSRLALRKRN